MRSAGAMPGAGDGGQAGQGPGQGLSALAQVAMAGTGAAVTILGTAVAWVLQDGQRRLLCPRGCGRTCRSQAEMRVHLRASCDLADARTSVEILGETVTFALGADGKRLLLCPVEGCGATLAQEVAMRDHLRGSHADRLGADVMPTSVRVMGVPVRVVTNAEGSRRFACPFHGCGQTFPQDGGLRGHMQRAHADRFGAEVLDRVTIDGMEVVIETTDEGQRRFACPFDGCSQTFAQPSSVRGHMRGAHSVAAGGSADDDVGGEGEDEGEEEMEVDAEDEADEAGEADDVDDVDGLPRVHGVPVRVETTADGAQRWPCPFADECSEAAFPGEAELGAHLQAAHAEQLAISVLGVSVRVVTTASGQRRLACPFGRCKRTFAQEGGVRDHMRRSHADRLSADVLPATASVLGVTVRFVASDDGQRRLACPFADCDQTFARDNGLRGHMRSAHPDRVPADARQDAITIDGMEVAIVVADDGERRFACPFDGCAESFTQDHQVRVHMRASHTDRLLQTSAKRARRDRAGGAEFRPPPGCVPVRWLQQSA